MSVAAQPVHCNVLWSSQSAARNAPRGDLDLVFCPTCGHIHNASFDPERTTYGGTYENSLHHSAVFQSYASDLVDALVERHELHDRDIVEIGAGHGDFLAMLCAAGDNRGTGFDPSHTGSENVADGVSVVPAFYGEEFADRPADLIVCRHVLEHIAESGDFVQMVRRVIGTRRSPAFFEVPNALWTLDDGGVWDLIYEHCGYFTPTSLSEVFRRGGFKTDRVDAVFGNQFLTIEATPVSGVAQPPAQLGEDIEQLRQIVDRFAGTYRQEIARWRHTLDSLSGEGRHAVVWGAGSKGVSFLNTVDTENTIELAVDINPLKHGMFVAGSGQEIVGPGALRSSPPDVVIVMNPNYCDEIGATLDDLGVIAEVLPA